MTWWGSPVECYSALWRLKRAMALKDPEIRVVLQKINSLFENTDLMVPSNLLRDRAVRLLSVHSLRSGDALQLAAALRWTHDQPHHVGFVCLDNRLRGAALAEGFHVFPEHD